jgi:hypothetical protein
MSSLLVEQTDGAVCCVFVGGLLRISQLVKSERGGMPSRSMGGIMGCAKSGSDVGSDVWMLKESVDVVRSAEFQRLFLFPATFRRDTMAFRLAEFNVRGIDNSCWHVAERPIWFGDRSDLSNYCSSWRLDVPPLSPMHAWLGVGRFSQDPMYVTRLFQTLLQTGCENSLILNAVDADGYTPLIYSLRLSVNTPLDSPHLLPFRLLMAHPLVNATLLVASHRTSALRTSLVYKHQQDVIRVILDAHPDPGLALVTYSDSACVQLLAYPTLARHFLLPIAAANPHALFAQSFSNAGDFFAELVEAQRDLWDAVTSNALLSVAPDFFRLPVRTNAPRAAYKDWGYRDGLRYAIRGKTDDRRALWLLGHTRDEDLDAYDCGGCTVLMRAVKAGPHFGRLIFAMLKRAPALEVDVRALVCMDRKIGDSIPPDAAARGDIVLGKTAMGMLLGSARWKPQPVATTAVAAALEAAQNVLTNRRSLAQQALAIDLPLPTELRRIAAMYAALMIS